MHVSFFLCRNDSSTVMGTNSPGDADSSLGVAGLGHTFSRTLQRPSNIVNKGRAHYGNRSTGNQDAKFFIFIYDLDHAALREETRYGNLFLLPISPMNPPSTRVGSMSRGQTGTLTSHSG
jgi:hypothetical protein